MVEYAIFGTRKRIVRVQVEYFQSSFDLQNRNIMASEVEKSLKSVEKRVWSAEKHSRQIDCLAGTACISSIVLAGIIAVVVIVAVYHTTALYDSHAILTGRLMAMNDTLVALKSNVSNHQYRQNPHTPSLDLAEETYAACVAASPGPSSNALIIIVTFLMGWGALALIFFGFGNVHNRLNPERYRANDSVPLLLQAAALLIGRNSVDDVANTAVEVPTNPAASAAPSSSPPISAPSPTVIIQLIHKENVDVKIESPTLATTQASSEHVTCQ